MEESGQGHRTPRGGDVEGQSSAAGKSPGDSALEAFSLFRSYLDSTLKYFKADLNCSQKKVKKEIVFKNESNKNQYLFNSEIVNDLEDLRRFDVADRVSDTINNVLPKLKYRNKILLVADSSPGGWLTVSEYEKPLLGSDSEDERRLRQAEARAVKKIKSSSFKSDSNVFHPYNAHLLSSRGQPEVARRSRRRR